MNIHHLMPLVTVEWTHMITACLPSNITDEEQAYHYLQKHLIRPLSKHFGIQITAVGAHNRLNLNHSHILISTNRKPTRLEPLNTDSLINTLHAANSPLGRAPIVHCRAVDDRLEAIRYIARNIPERSGKGGLFFSGRRQLDKLLVVGQ